MIWDNLMLLCGFAVVPAIIWFAVYRIGTIKKLRNNQSEWDRKKTELVNQGITFQELYNQYVWFIHDLYVTSKHSFLGACFPRYNTNDLEYNLEYAEYVNTNHLKVTAWDTPIRFKQDEDGQNG